MSHFNDRNAQNFTYHETPNDSRDSKFQNKDVKGIIDRKGIKWINIPAIHNSNKSTPHWNKDCIVFNEIQKVDFREMTESNKIEKDSSENEKENEEFKVPSFNQNLKISEGRNDSFDPENSEEGVHSNDIK